MDDVLRPMEPEAAAEVLRRTLDPTRAFTVADASVASGLALRDAEAGLNFLTSEHRGHLRVTEDGDLVHVFPHRFEKPWEKTEKLERALSAVWRAVVGTGRFIVRAWILVVLVGYALLFLGLAIGLTFARQGGDRDNSPAVAIGAGLFRMIAEALFWTFHPFSPFYVGYEPAYARAPARRRKREDDVPFYEKVNRFVFGPSVPPADPHAARARVLAEIRAGKGRIGLADVMRVTGLPRDKADPLMARLMLDHDGTVEVSEDGGILYRFEALRRTAGEANERRPRPAWESPPKVRPLTGNDGLANFLIMLLNGFNLLASGWVIAHGLTISNIMLLFERHRPPVLPYDGVPVALGLVPFVFSLGLFALPLARAVYRAREARKVAQETARLGVLREVLTHAPKKEPVTDEALRQVYRVATGEEPSSKTITARVVELGGDVDVGPEGEVRYRFADLEAEAAAVEEERENAPESEARLGKVIFASDR